MDSVDTFIARTSPSKVVIIVPLYGYWNTVKENMLGLDTLRLTLDRIQSKAHSLYIFFVAEPPKVPLEIANELTVRSHAGNTKGVVAPNGGSYGDYIREGLRVAQEETDAAYFIVVNPWVVIQKQAVDMLVDRINSADTAKLISGYDMADSIDPSKSTFAEAFDGFSTNNPKEERAVNSNLMGLGRYSLEMLRMDDNLKTAGYIEYDIWQQMFKIGFESISTQRIPMYVLPINIELYEQSEAAELDKVYFTSKWGFAPELKDK